MPLAVPVAAVSQPLCGLFLRVCDRGFANSSAQTYRAFYADIRRLAKVRVWPGVHVQYVPAHLMTNLDDDS